MNCSCLSLTARAARLAQVEEAGTPQGHEQAGELPAMRPSRRRSSTAQGAASTKRRKLDLAQRVDSMATEFEKIKELLLSLQPPAQTERVGVPAETTALLHILRSCRGAGRTPDSSLIAPVTAGLCQPYRMPLPMG